MQIRRCANSVCERPFQVNRFSISLQAWMEKGKITCPHCGMSVQEEGGFVFLTHALSPKEEAEFEALVVSGVHLGQGHGLHGDQLDREDGQQQSFGIA